MCVDINEKLTTQLLEWFDRNGRDLPWRQDPSSYHVLLSEIMLQQTRVETVIDYYHRFTETLPTIKDLAEADEDLCTKLWQGLGYYSRVRNLRRAAIMVMEEYQGSMPETYEELLKLPGVGPYSAAAIASICYDERIPAIDGNLLRIFSRMTGYREDIKKGPAKKAANAYYIDIFPVKRCGTFNQALMDLGATVCLPNGEPHCGQCPWSAHCFAREHGQTLELPIASKKTKRGVEEKTVFLIYYQGKLALRRRPEQGLLAGLYEYPNADGKLTESELSEHLKKLGFSAIRVRPLPDSKHIFSHKEWHMTGWEVLADEWEEAPAGEPKKHELFLASAEQLRDTYSIPTAFGAYTAQIRPDFME